MTATIQTIDTPDGAFTLVADEAGRVLASGWSADAGAVLGRIHASLRPTDADRQAIATQLWDELTDHLREHADRQRLRDDEQTLDEFLDGIEAFTFASAEWDNGYFPSDAIALGKIGDSHGVDLGIDLYLEDSGDGLQGIVSDHTADLILLSGNEIGRRWSYRLDRPAERPASTAQTRPATVEDDAA